MSNSDSSKNLSELMNFLEAHGVSFISDVKANRSPPIDFALFVTADRVGNRVGKGRTSQRQMKLLQRAIKEHLGLEVEWIVMPSQKVAALEPALFELLEARYPGAISSVIISSPKVPPVSVWVEPNPQAASWPGLTAVETLIKEFLLLYGLDVRLVTDGNVEELPSNPILLRNLKVHAPATTEQLVEVLRSRSFLVPDVHWLQTKLDTLRKNGLVLRSSDGAYRLTEEGLVIAPHGPYRLSSDVERALAFGKRKW